MAKVAPVRLALAFAALAAVMAGGILLAVFLALHAVQQSQRQWCTTLTLLTAKPVPRPADPSANPSREDAYRFYSNLVQLERNFGC